MNPKLQIIICSTRPGRIGPAVARWFLDRATSHGGFDAECVDLADFRLPVFDEPRHPRLQQYEHPYTQRWAQSVARADAYTFVTPEYNHSPPPSLVNALDFLYREWNYKPCAFVSYGGGAGGVRAVQQAILQVTMLKMMPIPESVAVQHAGSRIDGQGRFTPDAALDTAAQGLLDELLRWCRALQPLRA
ncbi:MAG: NADPH-dependent oxidoreductase [Nevskiaceae bacterium]|nr:MAG: NADPH-dependent oxidoreductase [Nevskiaceae bacterium]TBR73620.1 MAG: NADPH-dependent oxidoreductase [Nevskiaceae bacterium]